MALPVHQHIQALIAVRMTRSQTACPQTRLGLLFLRLSAPTIPPFARATHAAQMVPLALRPQMIFGLASCQKKRKYQLPVRNSTARGCLPFESVECPGSNGKSCAGNACCPDGSVCPSAENDFFGCHYSKRLDCTGLPTETALPSVALIALFV